MAVGARHASPAAGTTTMPGRARHASPLRPRAHARLLGAGILRPVDLLLLGYLSIVSAVAIVRAPSQPGCWWLLVAHGLVALLLALVTRPGLGRAGRTLREIYPLFLLPALYSELDVLNAAGLVPVHDTTVQQWEALLFGSQISRAWWQAAPSAFWSALLHGAYLSYYLIVSVPAFIFAARRDWPAVRHFVLAVVATFVVCYVAFIFFPVAGPYYAFPRPDAWFTANLPARLVYDALASGSSYGAAFPSSHVAATVAAALATARGSRRLGLILLLPTILLTVAVVYCQMHYAVDALAGLVVGGGVVLVLTARAGKGISPCHPERSEGAGRPPSVERRPSGPFARRARSG